MAQELAKGMIVKFPREGAPDYVKYQVSIKCEDFEATMKRFHKNGWLNIDIKIAKETGKPYASIFIPDQQGGQEYNNSGYREQRPQQGGQQGYSQGQQGGPQRSNNPPPRSDNRGNQGYNPQQNPTGYQQYTPPGKPGNGDEEIPQ